MAIGESETGSGFRKEANFQDSGSGVSSRSDRSALVWAQPSAECTERALLAQISDGNRSALAQLYLLYFQRLGNFFTQVMANPNLAEDLIAATMFDVWAKRERIGPNLSVFVWVVGIAYAHAYRRLTGVTSTRPHWQPAASDVEPTSPRSSAVGTPLRILDHLPRLTTEERTALYLVYCGRQSRQDVGHIMNISSESVDMHLTNARCRLRLSVDDAGDSTSTYEAPRSS
jgi:RNA polymerase sigma factor (sigma-70 family)